MQRRAALVLAAIGTGMLAGALFEVTLGVKRDTPVCDENGLNCSAHYSAAGFSFLMISLVVGIVGVVLLRHGLREWRKEEVPVDPLEKEWADRKKKRLL